VNAVAFRLALRHGVRAAALLGAGLGLFSWVILVSSSAFLGLDAEPLPAIFTDPPRVFRAFLGGSADFVSPKGWLSSGMLHPIVLALSTIAAFLVTSGTGAAELERGTLDLVLSRPVPRRAYLAARAAAGLVLLTIAVGGAFLGTIISREVVRGVDQLAVGDIAVVFAMHWLLFAGFSMIALMISARSRLRSRALGASIAVVVGAFFVNFVSLLFDSLERVGLITPFHYFAVGDVLEGRPYGGQMIVLGAIALVAAAIAVWEFERRDLTR
jgi:ABC-2 type transport system permease protein